MRQRKSNDIACSTGGYDIVLAINRCPFQHVGAFGCRDTRHFVGLPVKLCHLFIPIYIYKDFIYIHEIETQIMLISSLGS